MPAYGTTSRALRFAEARYSLYLLYWYKSIKTDAEALCC